MSLQELVVAGFFLLWFALSVLNQFHLAWFEHVKKWDAFALLPIWTFFAPNPGQSDYHCVYRDRLADGSLDRWIEVDLCEPRTPVSFIWNPQKRTKKVLSDLVASLLNGTTAEDRDRPEIVFSLPYLLLLNVVSNLPRDDRAQARQFVLVETFGFRPTAQPRLLLKSDFHAFS